MDRTTKIINGRAYTECDTKLLTDLPEHVQTSLILWINRNILPRKTQNYKYTSYGLKGFAERSIHHYITNNQFKDAMLKCGFKPVNPADLNWSFKISLRLEEVT